MLRDNEQTVKTVNVQSKFPYKTFYRFRPSSIDSIACLDQMKNDIKKELLKEILSILDKRIKMQIDIVVEPIVEKLLKKYFDNRKLLQDYFDINETTEETWPDTVDEDWQSVRIEI
jgi:uncharacterized membrane protein